ncbi:hypothetical protein [Methylobacterium sp. J-070]|uniref:hypothetical protein n=1 Tax=Methylobacterium sp. J-070 TaxID=2836650 RepID=UPI001FBAF283|nr:hypothetical protein [Methylobacterium sp. J-070]MCJ2053890.1 hypothetical protein [Methylobacterium sp. J-070]
MADPGLSSEAIHEARQLRDAETPDPVVIQPAFNGSIYTHKGVSSAFDRPMQL